MLVAVHVSGVRIARSLDASSPSLSSIPRFVSRTHTRIISTAAFLSALRHIHHKASGISPGSSGSARMAARTCSHPTTRCCEPSVRPAARALGLLTVFGILIVRLSFTRSQSLAVGPTYIPSRRYRLAAWQRRPLPSWPCVRLRCRFVSWCGRRLRPGLMRHILLAVPGTVVFLLGVPSQEFRFVCSYSGSRPNNSIQRMDVGRFSLVSSCRCVVGFRHR